MCGDCRSSGKYTGYLLVDICRTCAGMGWVAKGKGLSEAKYAEYLKMAEEIERRGFGE
jgi:DnaJ-class molecular chaperone